jgi:hypothetical protein
MAGEAVCQATLPSRPCSRWPCPPCGSQLIETPTVRRDSRGSQRLVVVVVLGLHTPCSEFLGDEVLHGAARCSVDAASPVQPRRGAARCSPVVLWQRRAPVPAHWRQPGSDSRCGVAAHPSKHIRSLDAYCSRPGDIPRTQSRPWDAPRTRSRPGDTPRTRSRPDNIPE